MPISIHPIRLLSCLLIAIYSLSITSSVLFAQTIAPQLFEYQTPKAEIGILKAPKACDRFEPSGVAYVHDRLWVVSDRDGWIASYDYPFKTEGKNKAKSAFQLNIPSDERTKWEGIESDEKGGFYLLEAISKSIWHCPSPLDGCKDFKKVEIDKISLALNDSSKRFAEDLNYMMLESVAMLPKQNQLFLGVRGYNLKTQGFSPSALILDHLGQVVLQAQQGLEKNGKHYSLSGLTVEEHHDDYHFWMTWSFEKEDDRTRNGVDGYLMVATISKKDWLAGKRIDVKQDLKTCVHFPYKPEGIAVAGEDIVLVFDEDKDRKTKKKENGEGFELTKKQDYVWRMKRGACLGR